MFPCAPLPLPPSRPPLLLPGEEAYLQYALSADGVLDLYHTEVPASHRGQGLGAVLAEVDLQLGDKHQ